MSQHPSSYPSQRPGRRRTNDASAGPVATGCAFLLIILLVAATLLGAAAMTVKTVTFFTGDKVEGTFVSERIVPGPEDDTRCAGQFYVAGDRVGGEFTYLGCRADDKEIPAVRVNDSRDLEPTGYGPHIANIVGTIFFDGIALLMLWAMGYAAWNGLRQRRVQGA